MFAAMAGEAGCRADELAAMAAALPGRADLLSRIDPTRHVWLDESGAFAAAFRPMALLPEDQFDNQPYVDHELIFVCRARLDDRAGLLQLLQIDSTRGASLSDADILRHCYKRWREETPQHVYGDFAFVAWERWSRRTLAATDHLGNFPLFYCRAGGRILFATQLSALLACPAVRSRLNIESLGLVAAGKPGRGQTMFAGINVLPGGELLVHHDELLRTERWWHPDTAPREVHTLQRDYVHEARALFDSAVASRLRARGGVIATMSGGLDSTLVTVTAARQLASSGKVLEALTAIPQPGMLADDPGSDNEEAAWARAVADFQPNIRQRLISPSGLTPLDILPAVHSVSHTPVDNPASLVWVWQMTARAAHNRAHVILCGNHGNQSISYAGDLSDAHFIRLRRLAAAAQRSWDRVRCIGTQPHRTRRIIRPGITTESRVENVESSSSERDSFTRAMMTPQSSARIDFITQFGVEWLDPTGDRKLLERLLTFPLHVFRVGNRPRGLARELGRGLLPDSVRLRRTRSAPFPDQTAWFVLRAQDYRKAFQNIRESGVCASILDVERLAALLDTLCAGRGTVAEAQLLHRALDAGSFALGFESPQRHAAGETAGHISIDVNSLDTEPGFEPRSHVPTSVPHRQNFFTCANGS
jgi:asparagine synthase (glutamine-hydrolysing)